MKNALSRQFHEIQSSDSTAKCTLPTFGWGGRTFWSRLELFGGRLGVLEEFWADILESSGGIERTMGRLWEGWSVG